jgi:hypothetical protein
MSVVSLPLVTTEGVSEGTFYLRFAFISSSHYFSSCTFSSAYSKRYQFYNTLATTGPLYYTFTMIKTGIWSLLLSWFRDFAILDARPRPTGLELFESERLCLRL